MVNQQRSKHCFGCDKVKISREWYVNKPTDLVLCSSCYHLIIRREATLRSARNYRLTHKRTINNEVGVEINGKIKKFKVYIPRLGVCNFCRAVVPFDCSYTHFAHIEYDLQNLSLNVIELCPKCHKYMDGFIKDPETGRFTNRGVIEA